MLAEPWSVRWRRRTQELEPNHRLPSLTEAYNEFFGFPIEYRDSVIYDLVMSSVEASGDSSSRTGKSTE